MNRTVEQKLLDLYVDNVDIIGEGFPAFVNSRRSEFIEAFNLCPLPDKDDERYRFSDMRALFGSREWEHYFVPKEESADDRMTPQENDLPQGKHMIALRNGFSDGGLTELDNGVVYGSLRAAAGRYPELVGAHYNAAADNKNESLTALNSAFMQDGGFLYVPDGVEFEEPVCICQEYAAQDEDVMGFGRALLVFGARSKARVQFVYRARLESGASCLADCVREAIVGENADVHITEAVLFEAGGHLVSGNYIRQAAGSRCESHLLDVSGGTVRINSTTDLAGPHAESLLYGLYVHGEREKCDLDVRVNHLEPDCRSYELVKGIAGGEALGAFAGLVYVAPDAQRTDGFQQNRNLLLSDQARIFTKPQLEIYADDVKCSHGATVGQLDEEAVYYMRQRGIGEDEARRLQLYGFVNDVLSHCTCDVFCGWMTRLTETRIERL